MLISQKLVKSNLSWYDYRSDSTFGKFDFIIAVHFDSIEKLAHFVNSELSKVKGVIRTETHIKLLLSKITSIIGIFLTSA